MEQKPRKSPSAAAAIISACVVFVLFFALLMGTCGTCIFGARYAWEAGGAAASGGAVTPKGD